MTKTGVCVLGTFFSSVQLQPKNVLYIHCIFKEMVQYICKCEYLLKTGTLKFIKKYSQYSYNIFSTKVLYAQGNDKESELIG